MLSVLPEPLGSEYALQELLGSGAFGLIYRVVSRSTGQQFALKVIEKSPLAARSMLHQLQREIAHLRAHVGTSHVVQLHEVVDSRDRTFLRTELCEWNLEDFVEERGALDEEYALHWLRQALLGVCQLHAAGTVHRDLKPGNMLVTADGTLQICDFGWACREDEALTGRSGTPAYAPPEMLQAEGPPHTAKVDMYSLGATFQHLLLGRVPDGPRDLPIGASPRVLDLIQELLHENPEERPSANDAFARLTVPGPFAELRHRKRMPSAKLSSAQTPLRGELCGELNAYWPELLKSMQPAQSQESASAKLSAKELSASWPQLLNTTPLTCLAVAR